MNVNFVAMRIHNLNNHIAAIENKNAQEESHEDALATQKEFISKYAVHRALCRHVFVSSQLQ